MIDFLNAFVALSNFVLIPAISYGAQLAIGALGVTSILGVALAAPEVRKSFLGAET